MNFDLHLPDSIHPVDSEFAHLYCDVACGGIKAASQSRVVFVGQVRQAEDVLPLNLRRVEQIASRFKSWAAVVVENDSTDGTKDILSGWQRQHPLQVVASIENYGWEKLVGFEAARVERFAHLRNKAKQLAAESFGFANYVVVVDLDVWGGWSANGLMNSLGWLHRLPDATGMASVSLYQADAKTVDGTERLWLHYDQWAFRQHGWQTRFGRWFPTWVPPCGAEPIRVCSAFGGMAVYRSNIFYRCQYAGGDCEHVPFHREMKRFGNMYLNPASVSAMHWLPPEADNGGQHGND